MPLGATRERPDEERVDRTEGELTRFGACPGPGVIEQPRGRVLGGSTSVNGMVANRGNPNEGKYYSAKNPSTMQIWRQEQVLDILKNVTTNPPDRVKEFSFKGSGGSYAKIFDAVRLAVRA